MSALWLCEMRGLIAPTHYGTPSYTGRYRLAYFDGFKVLQENRAGGWIFRGNALPLKYRGGVYGALSAYEKATQNRDN